MSSQVVDKDASALTCWCIFVIVSAFYVEICLAWFFSEMLAVPHRHQPNEIKYPPKRKKCAILSVES